MDMQSLCLGCMFGLFSCVLSPDSGQLLPRRALLRESELTGFKGGSMIIRKRLATMIRPTAYAVLNTA